MNMKFSRMMVAGLLIGLCSIPAHSYSAGVNDGVEDEVREHFSDVPAMVEIARCESGFRQFDVDGSALKGGWGDAMVGVFQFYEAIHQATANALGHDLQTLEGNIAYARHLYNESGTAPWNSAKACWSTAVSTPSAGVSLDDAEIKRLTQQVADLMKIVATLQTLLEQRNALSMR